MLILDPNDDDKEKKNNYQLILKKFKKCYAVVVALKLFILDHPLKEV